jgi:hypothetical protein
MAGTITSALTISDSRGPRPTRHILGLYLDAREHLLYTVHCTLYIVHWTDISLLDLQNSEILIRSASGDCRVRPSLSRVQESKGRHGRLSDEHHPLLSRPFRFL